MFGKKKLINILFWLTSKWVFQQVERRSWLSMCQFKPFLVFFCMLCALRLERWLSAIFQSLSLPFSHQEGRWLGDELETRCSSFFNFFRLVKEGAWDHGFSNQRFCCRSHSWIKYFLAVLPTWRREMCI